MGHCCPAGRAATHDDSDGMRIVDAVEIDVEELRRLLWDPTGPVPGASDGRPPVLLVDLDRDQAALEGVASPTGLHAVVVGRSSDPTGTPPEACDLVVDGVSEDEAAQVTEAVASNPVASITLVELLRCSPGMDVHAGLLAESASYGVLQSGREFRRWQDGRTSRAPLVVDEPVLTSRTGTQLHLTLHRPERRNALDVTMRDALAEQLQVVRLDPGIESILLDGAGTDFCAGGDLDEFGTFGDSSLAHLVRMERSLGRMLHAVADRLTVHLHGACIGSGIEMAAFAGSVHAAPDVSIGLPEVRMGLIPGAGGTVSLTRRIGRHRTCWLALTGARIDAATASEWGLVDRVEPAGPG